MTDPIRQYIDTHIPENHRQGDGCWDAAQKAMEDRAPLDENPCCYSLHEYEAVCPRTGLAALSTKEPTP